MPSLLAVLGGNFAYTRREPLGACGGIGAWNYPLQGTVMSSCSRCIVFKSNGHIGDSSRPHLLCGENIIDVQTDI